MRGIGAKVGKRRLVSVADQVGRIRPVLQVQVMDDARRAVGEMQPLMEVCPVQGPIPGLADLGEGPIQSRVR